MNDWFHHTASSLLPDPDFDDDWPDTPVIAQAYRAAVQDDRDTLLRLKSTKFTLALDRTVVTGLIAMMAAD